MAHNLTATLASSHNSRTDLTFLVLLFYIFAEYARPAVLAPIHPTLVAQLLVAWFLIANKKKVARVFRETFFSCYLWLLALMLLHVFLAANNYWAYMHLRTVLSYLLFGVAFCVFLDSVNKVRMLLTFFVAVIALCALDRLAGFGVFGSSGQMGDENDFALAMNMAMPISLFLGKSSRAWTKVFLFSATLLFVLGNIVSESRGGFIGLMAVGTYCWLKSQHKMKTIVVILLLAAVGWNFATPQFRAEVAGIGIESAESDTGKDRVELWKVGWRAFKDNPILGVGQGNMPVVMEVYQYDDKGESFWPRGLWGRAMHSIYFTALPELGLVGLFLIALMGWDIWHKHQKLLHWTGPGDEQMLIANISRGIMGGVITFLVTGVFLSAFYYPQLWGMSSMLVALFLAANLGTKSGPKRIFFGDSKQPT